MARRGARGVASRWLEVGPRTEEQQEHDHDASNHEVVRDPLLLRLHAALRADSVIVDLAHYALSKQRKQSEQRKGVQ